MSQMMKTMSFQVDEATANQVDELAERVGADPQVLLREALALYLDTAAKRDAGIARAREDILHDRLHAADDVHAWVAGWGTADESERPRPPRT
jgi:predicted transcriptional regulator